ncbi:DUF998 domain-containing protein [Gorillibacterium timonense]|uniref:DUF998 domain-containing protein n=1 Tax=Gorillibacterium timonense TaxID=1689269 RepID=UPI00071D8BE3|nr:DUF998 domain-containing protein [Gorillibacterium timonense]
MKHKHVKRLLMGSILFILASFIYLASEAITANAWSTPEYSYSYNYISDLGVSKHLIVEGREVLSPLAYVMNFGFKSHGILFLIAYLLVLPLLRGKSKIIGLIPVFVHSIGIILVSEFPGETYDKVSTHVIGATMAILGGNLALIMIGLAGRHLFPRLRTVSMIIGMVGIFALVMMVTHNLGYPAVFERMSVYTIIAWDLFFGFNILRNYYRQSKVELN